MIRKILFDKNKRKTVIELFSFIISIIFSAFNASLWLISASIWYLMLTIYYVSLSLARGGIFLKKRKSDSATNELTIYKRSAIFLLIMNFSVGLSTLLTTFYDGKFKYSGIFIYGASIYTLFKIVFAIINISKAHGTKNLLELSYRSINLVDGTFSLFAFQGALISRFYAGENNIANLITGSLVVLFNLSLGTFMLIKYMLIKRRQ